MQRDIESFFVLETSKYSKEQLLTSEYYEQVKSKILTDIQTLFNSKMIVDITFSYVFQ